METIQEKPQSVYTAIKIERRLHIIRESGMDALFLSEDFSIRESAGQ